MLMLLLLNNIPTHAVDRVTTTAIPANDFLNSIGVNSSINARGENITQTLECAEYLGFRWIRASVPDGLNTRPLHFQWLLQRNVRVSCMIGNGTTITDINNFVTGAKTLAGLGALIALEGPNEVNNWMVTYNGQKSWLANAQWQRDWYAAAKADSVLKNYPVWSLTEPGAETLNYGLQFLTIPAGANTLMPDGTKYADVACCHNYFCTSISRQNNQTWNAADPTSACTADGLYGEFGNTWAKHFPGYSNADLLTLPKVTTETGVTIDAINYTEQFQGLMYISTYLSQFKRGWSHTAMYILRDRSDESGNQTFGFYKPDYTPRLSAVYLHNLTTILEDNISIQSPSQFTYTISPARPATIHELLLQKNDRTLLLVLWSEKFANGSIADNITVDFDTPLGVVNVYNPTDGTEPVATFSDVSSIPLTMLNNPYILEINPTTTFLQDVKNENVKLATVYPNPVENFLTIKNANELKKIELFDFAGKLMMQLSDIHKRQINLDMVHLEKGCYLLGLTDSNNKIENCKIVKL
jgi:hypothetical protein